MGGLQNKESSSLFSKGTMVPHNGTTPRSLLKANLRALFVFFFLSGVVSDSPFPPVLGDKRVRPRLNMVMDPYFEALN